MVRNILALTGSGVRDWLIQRVTALLILAYVITLVTYVVQHAPLTYAAWHQFFACHVVKIVTTLILLSVVWHAWIGMWTVFTDYIKPRMLRRVLTVSVIIYLFYNLVWGLDLVWSI